MPRPAKEPPSRRDAGRGLMLDAMSQIARPVTRTWGPSAVRFANAYGQPPTAGTAPPFS